MELHSFSTRVTGIRKELPQFKASWTAELRGSETRETVWALAWTAVPWSSHSRILGSARQISRLRQVRAKGTTNSMSLSIAFHIPGWPSMLCAARMLCHSILSMVAVTGHCAMNSTALEPLLTRPMANSTNAVLTTVEWGSHSSFIGQHFLHVVLTDQYSVLLNPDFRRDEVPNFPPKNSTIVSKGVSLCPWIILYRISLIGCYVYYPYLCPLKSTICPVYFILLYKDFSKSRVWYTCFSMTNHSK